MLPILYKLAVGLCLCLVPARIPPRHIHALPRLLENAF
jgi:hypothetical protein